VDELVNISGDCPGLVLDSLKLRNFNKTGILFQSCRGEDGREVRIQSVKFYGSDDARSAIAQAIYFQLASRLPEQKYIRVDKCRFEKSFLTAIRVASPLDSCAFDFNVLAGSGGNGAFTVDGADTKTPIALKNVGFLSNTFSRFDHVFSFKRPLAPTSRIDIVNNLFHRITTDVARVEKDVQPDAVKRYCRGTHNIGHDPTAKKLGILANSSVDIKPLVFKIFDAPESADFLHYLNDQPAATAGKNNGPVGAELPLDPRK
jgi:hypothetical protein